MQDASQEQAQVDLVQSIFKDKVIVVPASDKRMSKCPEGYTLTFKECGTSDGTVWCRWRLLLNGQPSGRDMAIRVPPATLSKLNDENRTEEYLTSIVIKATQREVHSGRAVATPA